MTITIKTTGDRMKNSVKKKIIQTVLLNLLGLTMLLVFVSIISISNVLDDDSSEIMQHQCSESAQQINEELRNIEQSVNMMSSLLTSSLGAHDELLMNRNRFDIYMKMMRELGKNAVENTHGSFGAYLRFDPDVTDKGDFYWVKDSVTGEAVDAEVTDIKAYSSDDIDHVGWYYVPLEAKTPVWLDPYHKKDIGYEIISYVVPLYRSNGEPLGVIGMDIDITLFSELCSNVKVYNSGEAFIIDSDGGLIRGNGYAKDGKADFDYSGCYYGAPSGKVITSSYNGKTMLIMSQMLNNNMQFFIRVPKDEINAPKQRLISLLLICAGSFLVISVIVVFRWAERFTRPLLELTDKAKRIADNELDTELSCKTGDEVEVLSESLEKMVGSLKEHISCINRLAYIEPMTKLGNSLAYRKRVEELSADIADGTADFTIFVMDLNNLKKINDTYGHEKGDEYINNSASVIHSVFDEDKCYRIGGDEFAAVLGGKSEEEIRALIETLEDKVVQFNVGREEIYDQVHIAVGASTYRDGEDNEPADVFSRADSLMYKDKKRKKSK